VSAATRAHRAVRDAKRTRCPNALIPTYAWSQSSDRAYEISCGSWGCSVCGWRKQRAAALVVLNGCERALARGERVRFFTLTDGSAGEMTVADVYRAWNRLSLALRRAGKLREYAACVETTKAGALHLHVLATGSYIKQSVLSERAARSGFGAVVDIRAVKDDAQGARSARYISKELAGYITKQKAEALSSKTAVRRRPLRTSRGWGVSLRAAEKLLAEQEGGEGERDVGPWLLVLALPDGSLRIRGGREEHETPRLVPPERLPNGSEVATGAARRPRADEPTDKRGSASVSEARPSAKVGEGCVEEGGRSAPLRWPRERLSEKVRARDGPGAQWAA